MFALPGTRKPGCAVLALLLLTLVAGATEPEAPLKPLTLQNLYFEPVTIGAREGVEAQVLFFFSNTCPVARRYMRRMAEIADQYRERGVRVIGVNASPADPIQDVAQHALEYGLTFPVLKDAQFDAVRALGISRTPEVVVLDGSFVLRYRGRIDDQYRLGGVRPEVGSHDLRDALEAVLAGEAVAQPRTQAEGCAITFPMLPAPTEVLSYHKHVRPVLEAHCTGCHHTGGSAPMPLDSYESVAQQAPAILEAITDRRMPPWLAAGEHAAVRIQGLASRERHLIANWLRGDRPIGPVAVAPEPRSGTDFWRRLAATATGAADPSAAIRTFAIAHQESEAIWISGIGVEGRYDTGFAFAELFIETGDATESRRRLTGPIVPGQPLQWPVGEAIHLPGGAQLIMIAHYRPQRLERIDEPPAVLLVRAQGMVTHEILCTTIEEDPRNDEAGQWSVPLPHGTHVRAAAVLAPRGTAVMLTAFAVGDREDRLLLSLPACDPAWPLTYWIDDTSMDAGVGTALRWEFQHPTYFLPVHPEPAAEGATERGGQFFHYIAQPVASKHDAQ